MVRIILMNFTLVAWMGLMSLNEDKEKVQSVLTLKLTPMEKCINGLYLCKIISRNEINGPDCSSINFYLMKSLKGLGQLIVESE